MTSETSEPNWTAFYELLRQVGPDMLEGLPEDLQDWVVFTAEETDQFWPLLQDAFYTFWGESTAEREHAVRETLERWTDNVRLGLEEIVDITEESPQKRERLRACIAASYWLIDRSCPSRRNGAK